MTAVLDLRQLPLEPESLAHKVRGAGSRAEKLAKLIGGETAAYTVLSVGDLLYDAFRIDPRAIEGIDFARAADLSDIYRFAHFSSDLFQLSSEQFAGNFSQIQGYVGERVVAHALRAEGAVVEFPRGSAEPGWDLLVNGQRYQVKCVADPSGIHEHFKRYPDIPVIANSEMAEFFEQDPRVTIIDEFSYSDVVARTSETLEAGADLLDLEIPLITGAIVAARVGLAVLRGQSDPLSALGSATIDMGSRVGAGIGAAAVAGSSIAFLGITGGWMAVMAPVFGNILGYRGGIYIGDQLKRHLLCRSEAERLQSSLREFSRAAAAVLEEMLTASMRFRKTILALSGRGTAFSETLKQDWLRRIQKEIEHREFYCRRLSMAAEDPRSIDRSLGDLRAVAARVIWTAAQGGVLQSNLPTVTRRLQEAVSDYDRRLKRWLIR